MEYRTAGHHPYAKGDRFPKLRVAQFPLINLNYEPRAMIANTNIPVLTARIDYCIAATEQGWQLTAWEPAHVEGNRVKPYLWKFHSEHETLGEVHRTLQLILGEF